MGMPPSFNGRDLYEVANEDGYASQNVAPQEDTFTELSDWELAQNIQLGDLSDTMPFHGYASQDLEETIVEPDPEESGSLADSHVPVHAGLAAGSPHNIQ